MNDNNYKDLTVPEFIEILEGTKTDYYLPQTANLQYSYQMTNQAYRASGLDSAYTILIPKMHQRDMNRVKHNLQSSVPQEYWPDFDDPYVYRVHSTFWNRGMNISSGEGPKPELSLGIDLLNCEFNDSFHCLNIKSTSGLRINKCTFSKHISNNNTEGGIFSMTSCAFKYVELTGLSSKLDGVKAPLKSIKFKDLKTDELTINNIYVDELIIDCKGNSIQKIKISNSIITTLIIKGNEYEDIELSSLTVDGQIQIDSQFKKFTLTGKSIVPSEQPPYYISRILFSVSSQTNKGKYLFRDALIHKLEIYGVNNNSILFKSCSINIINIRDFANPGDLSLHNIDKINEIHIENSSMGKAELLDVDLSKPAVSKIVSSNILDVVLIDTIFPDVLTANTQTDFKGIRDAFRQLKLASGKQGNRIQELKYEAFEMESYKRDKNAIKTLDEKAILLFNKLTNNHGQNWLIPLLEILILTIPAFMLIKLQLGYTFVFGSISAIDFGQYLEFAFNPLHNFITIFGEDKTISSDRLGIARLIDVAAKIVSGLLIFQLIRAFRKYVK